MMKGRFLGLVVNRMPLLYKHMMNYILTSGKVADSAQKEPFKPTQNTTNGKTALMHAPPDLLRVPIASALNLPPVK